MNRVRNALGGAVLIAASLAGSLAHADNTLESDQFFSKGMEAMGANNYALACPLLQRSVDLKPRAGALFQLGDCYDRGGRPASAVAVYSRALSFIGNLPPEEAGSETNVARVTHIKDRLAVLKPIIPTVTLMLPAGLPPGTTVKLDGRELPLETLGLPWEVDPGEHIVVAQIPGGPEATTKFAIQINEKKSVEVQVLAKPADPPPNPNPNPNPNPAHDTGTSSGAPTAAYVVGGIGVVGLAVGSIAGIIALSKSGTVKDNCVETICNQQGYDAATSAKGAATISTVGFVIGIIGVTVGTILYLSAPKADATQQTALVVPKRPKWEPVVGKTNGGAFFGLQGEF